MTERTLNIVIVPKADEPLDLVEDLERVDFLPLRVTCCRDLEHALEQLDDKPVDVALVQMHRGVNGVDPVRRLRERHPRVALVAISTVYDQDQAIACLQAGAQDYVAKRGLHVNRLVQCLQFAVAREHWRLTTTGNATDTAVMTRSEKGVLSRIPGYRIVRLLGIGSMGTVYLVRRRVGDPEQLYALKIPNLAHHNEEMRRRFLREADVTASIQHPNIVRVHEIGCTPGADVPYMVMEYVDGPTMDACFDELFAWDDGRKAALILQLSRALEVIHERFVCHRDIKPRNIMMTGSGDAKIADFGTVRLVGSDLTLPNEMIGTPGYMAPESFRSAQVDARADIWALGVIAYRLFVGRQPFRGESLPALAQNIQTLRPLDPRRQRPDFPRNLRHILARMLKKDPAKRFRDARQVSAALETFIAAGPTDSLNLLELITDTGDWS